MLHLTHAVTKNGEPQKTQSAWKLNFRARKISKSLTFKDETEELIKKGRIIVLEATYFYILMEAHYLRTLVVQWKISAEGDLEVIVVVKLQEDERASLKWTTHAW